MHFRLVLKLPLRHPLKGISTSTNWEETLGAAQDLLEGLHLRSGQGAPRGAAGLAGGSLWVSINIL